MERGAGRAEGQAGEVVGTVQQLEAESVPRLKSGTESGGRGIPLELHRGQGSELLLGLGQDSVLSEQVHHRHAD